MHDGQECAEKRHTAARSLDTEKVGHGFFFFYGVQYRIATICGIAVSETYIFIYTSICIVPNIMFTQILRRKQMLRRISGSRVPSRLGADTTSTPAAAAAAVPGLESTKGSAPGATSGSTEPK